MFTINRDELPVGALAEFPGRDIAAGTSLIFVDLDRDGDGPALHQHPYSETFIILSGQAEFTIGDEVVIGVAGQVLIVPAVTPHRFAKTGVGRLQMIDVHASDHFITEWL